MSWLILVPLQFHICLQLVWVSKWLNFLTFRMSSNSWKPTLLLSLNKSMHHLLFYYQKWVISPCEHCEHCVYGRWNWWSSCNVSLIDSYHHGLVSMWFWFFFLCFTTSKSTLTFLLCSDLRLDFKFKGIWSVFLLL